MTTTHAASSETESLQDQLRASLQPILDMQAKRIDSGVILAFKNKNVEISLASGSVARLNEPEDRKPIKTSDRLMWGSITKMYTVRDITRFAVAMNDAVHICL